MSGNKTVYAVSDSNIIWVGYKVSNYGITFLVHCLIKMTICLI